MRRRAGPWAPAARGALLLAVLPALAGAFPAPSAAALAMLPAAALATPPDPAPAPPPAQDAAGPSVAVLVDPPSGEVGLRMTLTLSVAGDEGADCALVALPSVDGARLALAQGPSTSQSTVIVNGRLSRSLRTEWRFHLVPERAGTLLIPPFRMQCRGAETASRPLELRVEESRLGKDVATLAVSASATELWTGQVFRVEVAAGIDEDWAQQLVSNGLEIHLPWLAGHDGLLPLDEGPLSGGNVQRLIVAGRREPLEVRMTREDGPSGPRIVFRRGVSMLATEPGRIELPESRFSATLAMETRPERSDPFGFFGDRLVVTRWGVADATAAGPALEVRAPPEEGRPPGFTNAVGRFRLAGEASPASLAVGETCTLTLTLTGEGNLDFVQWPAFDELSADFRIFGKTERRLPRTRVLEFQISPKHARVRQVPALAMAAFDAERGAYDVLVAGPYPLEVRPGGEDGLATLESAAETLGSLETIRETLPEPGGAPVPAWWLWLPGVLAWAGAELASRRASWRQRNARRLVARGARGRLEERLGAAREVREVSGAFSKFLSERLEGPPAGLTADEAAQRLERAGAEPALVAELRERLARWEGAWLGGAGVPLDEARGEALDLARRVERAA